MTATKEQTVKFKAEKADPRALAKIVESAANRGEGARNLLQFVRYCLSEKGARPEDFSIRGLALATGAMDAYDPEGSIREALAEPVDTRHRSVEKLLQESNPGLNSALFKIVTGELINAKVIEAYNVTDGFIGDRLVSVMSGQRLRNQRIAGFTSLAGPNEVKEGHPYEESGFGEKYVVTKESKKGRILSINEELILMDQTGEIMRRAGALGDMTRQERERTIVRAVTDADAATDPVFRPSGTGETLYATDGSNYNWVGAGNTVSGSPYNAAKALQDWTDLQEVKVYRSTQIKDDRIDGTPRPIAALNAGGLILLVPGTLEGTAKSIINATEIRNDTTNQRTSMMNPVAGMAEVLTSPFIDEQIAANAQAANDWFLGQFARQFVWTEIWPVQTFVQSSDSESAFDRDVTFRIKVRYYGGVSAVDSVFVTKVDGA